MNFTANALPLIVLQGDITHPCSRALIANLALTPAMLSIAGSAEQWADPALDATRARYGLVRQTLPINSGVPYLFIELALQDLQAQWSCWEAVPSERSNAVTTRLLFVGGVAPTALPSSRTLFKHADLMKKILPSDLLGCAEIAGRIAEYILRPAIVTQTAIDTHGDLDERLRSLVRRILRLDPAHDLSDAAMGHTPGWDSLAHLSLLLAIEETFACRIAAADMARTHAFSNLCALLTTEIKR